MALRKQMMHFPLWGGLDTKTHPHGISPPKLLACNNVVFDEPSALDKRPGSVLLGLSTVSGGSITASRTRALGRLGDELVLFAEGRVYTLSDKESAWVDRGRFESLLPDYETILGDGTDQVTADTAQTGNVRVIAWEDRTNAGVRWACIDTVTGAPMQSSSTPYLSGAQRPRCLALNSKLLVFLYDATGSAIKCDVIDPTDVYGTLGASLQTIATDEMGPFDVDNYSSTECVIAYVATGSVATIKKVDSTGTVTATRATGDACDVMIAINYHATPDRFALVRHVNGAGATGGDLFLDWLKGTDLTDDSTFVGIAVVADEGADNIHNIAVSVLSGQTAYVFWDVDKITAGSPGSVAVNGRQYATCYRATVTTSASTERVLARRACLGSRPIRWSDGSAERVMIHVYYSSDLQSQYALLDADFVVGDRNDNNANRGEVGILARLFPGEGPSTTGSRTSSGVGGGLFRKGVLPQVESQGSNVYASALTYTRSTETTSTSFKRTFHERGIRYVTYTAFDSRAFVGREEGGNLYGPGGYVWAYNKKRVVESGFWLYPDFSPWANLGAAQTAGVVTPSPSTGSLTNSATYYYRWYYEFRYPSGERERSTYSGSIRVVMGAADDTVTWNLLPTLQFTSKWRGITSSDGASVRLVGYRSLDGTNFYRICSFDPASTSPNPAPENNPNALSVSFVDLMSDVDLVNQEPDYISNGEVDNISPPATAVIASGQSRIFVRHPENKNLILFSKQRQDGEAVSFNARFSIPVPRDGGDVTGIVITEDGLLIFTEFATYVAIGRGPSNTDGPPSYSDPKRTEDVGCIEPRSIVRTSRGIFFRSKKGMYIMRPTGGQAEYIGAGIEDYNTGYDIRGAVDVPDKHRVEFTTASAVTGGVVLVYDYYVNEWSIWNSTSSWGVGRHSVLWGDVPVRLDAVGVWKPQTTFADGSAGYTMLATMRIRPGGLMGWVKNLKLWVLGEYRSAHDLRVVLTYDDSTATETFNFPSITSDPNPYRFRVGPSRLTESSITITVSDLTPTGGGDWRESMKLTGFSLQVGLMPGGPRLPATQME